MRSISSLIALLSYATALCGIVPLFPWLTPAPRLLLLAGLAAGIWQERRGSWPVKGWLLNAALLPAFLYYAARFSRTNAIEPVVSLLAIMLAVRLFGEKSGRHYLQIQALSLFCLAASSLFDLSPLFLVYLTLMLFMVALELVLLTFHSQNKHLQLSKGDMARVLLAGLSLPLLSLPLLLFFFPLLPRTPIPLWNLAGAPLYVSSGFSDKVEPGLSPTTGESPVLAFRAEMPRLPQRQLYWRGTVFNRLEGKRWVRDRAVPEEQPLYDRPWVTQLIYPQPGLSRFLIALDGPATVSAPRVRSNPDATFELPAYASRRQTYGAESSVSGRLRTAAGIRREFYLRLPKEIPARISRLGHDIRRQAGSDSRRLELLELYFRNNNFRYAKEGLPTGEHALELFLFENRQGHCEFFASAFAVIARSAGIPARLVGGYLGGEYNDLGGYYQVGENRAHVWVEAYLDGRGWQRIDPSAFAVNAGSLWGTEPERSLLLRLRMALDSLDHAWNRSVISYDFEHQVTGIRAAAGRLQSLDPGRLLPLLSRLLLLLAPASALLFLLTRRRQLFPTREERLLRRFFKKVEQQCGVSVVRGRQGLFEIAEATGNPSVREFVAIYAGALYRDRQLTADEIRALRRILEKGFS
jgi:transglutaminase-like putative cysteine protease